jgi:hypothetical protein
MHFRISVVGVLAALSAVVSSTFTQSCFDCHIDPRTPNNAGIRCDCRQPDGQYRLSALDLNRCYANANGNITPRQE